MARVRSGLTLIEVAATLACMAVMAAFLPLATGSEVAFARRVAARIVQARSLAAASGSHVAVGATSCGAADLRLDVDAGDAVRTSFPSRGLLFTPDGLPRTCDGGGVGNTTILLEHRGRTAAVIVSSLGRVRWEMR